MNSPQVEVLVTKLIDWYSQEEKGLLTLNVLDIPESDINFLVALLLSQDDELAAEATGPDNPEFYSTILPALTRSLKMPNNGFESEEFRDIYNSSIRNYLMPRMERLISEKLESLNEDRECHTSLVFDRTQEKVVEIHRIG